MNKVKEFKSRLIYACNKSAKVPDFGRGQQVVIAEQMRVSQEAVRKWFSGISKPRPNAMKALASFLDVPYVWLSLGTDHEETAVLREMSNSQDASLYAFVAYILGKGGSVAFNKTSNCTSDVTVIEEGEVTKYSVYSATNVTDTHQQFKLTSNSPDVQCVCAIRIDTCDIAYDFITVPMKEAAEYASRDVPYVITNESKVPLKANAKER